MATLPVGEPVWIIQSPTNTPVAQQLWKEQPRPSHLVGITTFRPSVSDLPEENLLSVLDDIELHHGHHSADPPYSVLEVIGCEPSLRVSAALDELGFSIVERSTDGFIARTRTSNENTPNT
ncbi:MAG: hypothetical protein WC740_17160 [Verrucomicrobiia bacterium]